MPVDETLEAMKRLLALEHDDATRASLHDAISQFENALTDEDERVENRRWWRR